MNRLRGGDLVNQAHSTALSIGLLVAGLLAALPAAAQWSAQPGATVRNAFGPQVGNIVNECRGACGAGCPDSCAETVTWECQGSARLRRVVTYDCGTHEGCRVHDDCLDACLQSGVNGAECATRCDADVVERFGIQSALSWFGGGEPYDGRISYVYTQDTPGALEPAYTCPDGASRQCGGDSGCIASDAAVAPVFDTYPAAGAGAMRVSAFRAGPACGDSVCEQSAVIKVTGADACAGGRCTRFGMEFDYQNADPSAPLECKPSTSGGESDFIGDMLKQGADAMTTRNAGAPSQSGDAQADDGMAQLLGMFGKVLASGDSPEDVQVSMAPLGPDGKPIESQRVGSAPRDGPPPIPRSITLPAASGHLFVPMYELADGPNASPSKQRHIRCTHKGAPVLETIFVLNAV